MAAPQIKGAPYKMECLTYHLVSLLLLVLLLAVPDCYTQSGGGYIVRPAYDICNPQTEATFPNTVYLPSSGTSTIVYVNMTKPNMANVNCLMYFKTCDLCRIRVDVVEPFRYSACRDDYLSDDVCILGCVYLILYDGDYKQQTIKRISKSDAAVGYKSESKRLYVVACGLGAYGDIKMSVRLTSEEKVETINGTADDFVPYQTFSSPFFPSPYTKNGEFYRYDFQASRDDEFIAVSFDDWLLSPLSSLQFEKSSNALIVTGSAQRPFVFSQGSSMTLVFSSGDNIVGSSTYLGFKAVARFYESRYDVPSYSTACDRLNISSEGGVISLDRQDGMLRDCIWLIKRSSAYDGVYLKLLSYRVGYDMEYSDMSGYSLQIKEGITSTVSDSLNIRPYDSKRPSTVFFSDNGFYIRIKGRYYADDSVVVAYAMYLEDCSNSDIYFKCDSGRCISANLKCDSFDHCGDSSDEMPNVCYHQPMTRPSSGSSTPISITIIIPLVVSVFLVIVMCLLIIFIRRCRRLNNSVNGRRPNGRQTRGRNRRRGVQMSVTLSSGEQPPSYDDVIQNTPIGYLNMAFSWSQHGNILTQPPSYEEAISPTSNGSAPAAAAAGAPIIHGDAHRNSASVMTATLSASLDPRAEVSSSSSSEDATDRYSHLNTSTSSDSSIENVHTMIHNQSNLEHSRSNTNLNKINKDNRISNQTNAPKLGGNNSDGIQVVLESSASLKCSNERLGFMSPESSQQKEELKESKSIRSDGADVKSHGEIVKDTEVMTQAANTRASADQKHLSERDGYDNLAFNGSDEIRVNDRDRGQGRERSELYRKLRHKYDTRERLSKHSDHPLGTHPSKITNASRSQSCADLSWGTGTERQLGVAGIQMRDQDKRFSYAGAGDVSLGRGSLNQFYEGRGLVREKPLEHLDRFSSQSCSNLRDGYAARGYRNPEYETMDNHDDSYSRSLDDYSRRKRDNSGLQMPHNHHHAAVHEKLSNEHHGASKLPSDISRYKHSKDNKHDSRMRSEVPNSFKNTSYPPPSASKRSVLPDKLLLLTADHDSSSTEGVKRRSLQGHYSQKQAVPSNHGQNVRHLADDQNLNPSNHRNVTRLQDNDRSPQSDSRLYSQDRVLPHRQEAPAAAPKPTARTQFKGLQNVNRDKPEVVPYPTSRSNFHPQQWSESEDAETVPKSTSKSSSHVPQWQEREEAKTELKSTSRSGSHVPQKPTPAPRSGIRKQNNASETHLQTDHRPLEYISHGRPSQQQFSGGRSPDTYSSSSSSQVGNRAGRPTQSRHEDRDRTKSDGSSGRDGRQPAMKSSNSQMNLQATDDDVFV